MSTLRVLGVAYLDSASAFVMAATFAAHPTLTPFLKGQARAVAEGFQAGVLTPAREFARRERAAIFEKDEPVRTIAIAPPQPGELRTYAHSSVPPIRPHHVTGQVNPQFAARLGDIIAPDLPAGSVAEPAHGAPPTIASNHPSPVNERAAGLRLKASLTPEMLASFDLFLYVSKADRGPLAQRMYVFQKQPGDMLKLRYDWAASTGREKEEVSAAGQPAFTDTPRGYYQLDPARMYWRYHSTAWNQSMPFSMFFNWQRQGLQTGLAIHGATGADIDKLGQRASAGCVHIAPENAELLYHLIQADYQGTVPRPAYDARTATTSTSGDFQHDAKGHLAMARGYKVLIFIEDYGGENVVAALF